MLRLLKMLVLPLVSVSMVGEHRQAAWGACRWCRQTRRVLLVAWLAPRNGPVDTWEACNQD